MSWPPEWDHVFRLLDTGKVKAYPGYWRACCPAHEDLHPSMSVSVGRGGRLLLKCHRNNGAGCSFLEIVSALSALNGKAVSLDPWGRGRGKNAGAGWQNRVNIIRAHDYTDEYGELLYQTLRLHPKNFKQRRVGPSGEWVWNMDGVRRVLYRLPELLAEGRVVLYCDGERDVDTAWELGCCATTSVGGGGNAHLTDFSPLRGRHVGVVMDLDRPDPKRKTVAGFVAAHQVVVLSLEAGAKSVKVIRLDGEAPLDLTQWVRTFRHERRKEAARGRLEAIYRASPYWDEWGPVGPG